MADLVQFKVDGLKAVRDAYKLAPKKVISTIMREFKREGEKFRTEYRKQYLFGPPGINLPKRVKSFTKTGKVRFKKRLDRDSKQTQLAHVIVKLIPGKRSLVLAAYLSRFLTYHAKKLDAPFRTLFRSHAARIPERLAKAVPKITQAVLDKGLRDAKRQRGQ